MPYVPTRSIESLWQEQCDLFFKALPQFADIEEDVRQDALACLVGLLSHIARTEAPDRDGLTNLFIYVFSYYTDLPVFNQRRRWDEACLLGDLNLTLTGGKDAILQRGFSLISLVQLHRAEERRESDAFRGRFNPLNAGLWDFDEIRAGLVAEIKKTPCRKMDRIIKVDDLVPAAV